MVAFIIP
jgi:ATP-dependent RNA helicase DDX52/ROK1